MLLKGHDPIHDAVTYAVQEESLRLAEREKSKFDSRSRPIFTMDGTRGRSRCRGRWRGNRGRGSMNEGRGRSTSGANNVQGGIESGKEEAHGISLN